MILHKILCYFGIHYWEVSPSTYAEERFCIICGEDGGETVIRKGQHYFDS